MTLDEATSAMLSEAVETGGPPLHEMTIEEARMMSTRRSTLFGDGPAVSSVRDVTISTVEDTPFYVRIFRPESPQGVLVYYHGGGWVIGNLGGFDTLCRQLVDRTGMSVLLVAYRKAPEHPYPAAVEDAWAALRWADERRGELASRGAPLIVAGDSAGGNLAAVVAQRTVEEKSPALAFQVLVYPVTDADFENETYNDPRNDLLLGKQAMMMFWDLYAPRVADRSNPDAAPLHGDPSGAPPALVLLAEHDVLRHEGQAYAQKLRDCGVPVQEHMVAGQMHGFFTYPNVLPGANTGMDIVADALRHVTGGANSR